jgi:hypothetical protein
LAEGEEFLQANGFLAIVATEHRTAFDLRGQHHLKEAHSEQQGLPGIDANNVALEIAVLQTQKLHRAGEVALRVGVRPANAQDHFSGSGIRKCDIYFPLGDHFHIVTLGVNVL